jgi:hypothetical protein
VIKTRSLKSELAWFNPVKNLKLAWSRIQWRAWWSNSARSLNKLAWFHPVRKLALACFNPVKSELASIESSEEWALPERNSNCCGGWVLVKTVGPKLSTLWVVQWDEETNKKQNQQADNKMLQTVVCCSKSRKIR